MKILVVSDTHLPRSAKDVPEALYEAIKEADLVLHAGDFTEVKLLKKLESMKKTVAVCGNMDTKEISSVLKSKEIVTAGKFRIGLIHGQGASDTITERLLAEFEKEKVDCIVFGHTHKPMNERIGSILFFNPGSPTDKIFSPYNSYGVLEIDENITGRIIKL